MISNTNKEFENKGWEKMKILLDSEMPEKKRRIVPIFWLLGSVAASIAVFFIYTSSILQYDSATVSSSGEKNDLIVQKSTTQDLSNEEEKASNEVNYINNNSAIVLNNDSQISAPAFSQKVKEPNTKNTNTKESAVVTVGNYASSVGTHIGKEVKTSIATEDFSPPANTTPSNLSEQNQTAQPVSPTRTASDADIAMITNDNQSKSETKLFSSSTDVLKDQKNGYDPKLGITPTPKSDISAANEDRKKNVITVDAPIDPIQSIKKLGLYAESGINTSFLKKYGQQYHLGVRYEFMSQKNIAFQIAASGFLSPIDINFSIPRIVKDINNKADSEDIKKKVNLSSGVNLSGIARIMLRDRIYFLYQPGLSIVNYKIENAEKGIIPQVSSINHPNNLTYSSTPISTLNYKKVNVFGSLGVGYQLSHVGMELYYRIQQNSLRNSGLPGYSSIWFHQLGMNVMYGF